MDQAKNLAFIESVCKTVDAIEDKVQRVATLNDLTRRYAVFGQYYANVHLNKALDPAQFVQSYGALPALNIMREDYETREAATTELPALSAKVLTMEAKLDRVLSMLESLQGVTEDDEPDPVDEPVEEPKPRKARKNKDAEPANDPATETDVEGAEEEPEDQ